MGRYKFWWRYKFKYYFKSFDYFLQLSLGAPDDIGDCAAAGAVAGAKLRALLLCMLEDVMSKFGRLPWRFLLFTKVPIRQLGRPYFLWSKNICPKSRVSKSREKSRPDRFFGFATHKIWMSLILIRLMSNAGLCPAVVARRLRFLFRRKMCLLTEVWGYLK